MNQLVKLENESTANRIVACVAHAARRVQVVDVRIGLGYTAVKLADGRTGVAYTFGDQAQRGCSVLNEFRLLTQRSAFDLLDFLKSEDVIEAGVGLACANAVANIDSSSYLLGDILEHLDLRPDDTVGMVGHFGPLVPKIQCRVRSLVVFERVEKASGLLRPTEEAKKDLPRCQVALITATSIINHTIEGLLEAAKGCREVVVLGPSTPLLPVVFAGKNVTMLSGVVVNESEKILRVVSEGGGMRFFSPHIQKVCVRLRD